MKQESELLDQVILFLIFLVSAILVYAQYQFSKLLSNSMWNYISLVLILVLVGAILLLALNTEKKSHAFDFTKKEAPKPWTFMEKLTFGMVGVVALLIVFNQMQISQASTLLGVKTLPVGLTFKSSSAKTPLALTGDPSKDAMTIVIPRGVPFYGEALGVSFDDPINGLEKIAQLDPSYGKNRIQLTQEEKARYIKIDTTPYITCEFCCGAKTAVTQSGQPSCGCKHSWAIRGLTAYLIKNYPTLSDEEIIKEIVKWKGLFFPKQMIQRYIQQSQTGQYTNDIAALLLDVDETKLAEMRAKVATAGPAGDSSTAADLDELPNMVGGC